MDNQPEQKLTQNKIFDNVNPLVCVIICATVAGLILTTWFYINNRRNNTYVEIPQAEEVQVQTATNSGEFVGPLPLATMSASPSGQKVRK